MDFNQDVDDSTHRPLSGVDIRQGGRFMHGFHAILEV